MLGLCEFASWKPSRSHALSCYFTSFSFPFFRWDQPKIFTHTKKKLKSEHKKSKPSTGSQFLQLSNHSYFFFFFFFTHRTLRLLVDFFSSLHFFFPYPKCGVKKKGSTADPTRSMFSLFSAPEQAGRRAGGGAPSS